MIHKLLISLSSSIFCAENSEAERETESNIHTTNNDNVSIDRLGAIITDQNNENSSQIDKTHLLSFNETFHDYYKYHEYFLKNQSGIPNSVDNNPLSTKEDPQQQSATHMSKYGYDMNFSEFQNSVNVESLINTSEGIDATMARYGHDMDMDHSEFLNFDNVELLTDFTKDSGATMAPSDSILYLLSDTTGASQQGVQDEMAFPSKDTTGSETLNSHFVLTLCVKNENKLPMETTSSSDTYLDLSSKDNHDLSMSYHSQQERLSQQKTPAMPVQWHTPQVYESESIRPCASHIEKHNAGKQNNSFERRNFLSMQKFVYIPDTENPPSLHDAYHSDNILSTPEYQLITGASRFNSNNYSGFTVNCEKSEPFEQVGSKQSTIKDFNEKSTQSNGSQNQNCDLNSKKRLLFTAQQIKKEFIAYENTLLNFLLYKCLLITEFDSNRTSDWTNKLLFLDFTPNKNNFNIENCLYDPQNLFFQGFTKKGKQGDTFFRVLIPNRYFNNEPQYYFKEFEFYDEELKTQHIHMYNQYLEVFFKIKTIDEKNPQCLRSNQLHLTKNFYVNSLYFIFILKVLSAIKILLKTTFIAFHCSQEILFTYLKSSKRYLFFECSLYDSSNLEQKLKLTNATSISKLKIEKRVKER